MNLALNVTPTGVQATVISVLDVPSTDPTSYGQNGCSHNLQN